MVPSFFVSLYVIVIHKGKGAPPTRSFADDFLQKSEQQNGEKREHFLWYDIYNVP